jgi:hypothetical protein
MTLLKTILFLLAFIGAVGYLETVNIIYLLLIVIGVIWIIKISLNK